VDTTEGNSDDTGNGLVELLEKQKKDLVIRVLKKHEELQAGKEFTNKILTSLSEIFFLLDKEFYVVQSNKEFNSCLGYTPDWDHPCTWNSWSAGSTAAWSSTPLPLGNATSPRSSSGPRTAGRSR